MKKSNLCIFVLICLEVTGCYSYGGYQPTVDSFGDKNAYRINQDMAECRQLAEQSSGGTTKNTAIGAGTGALLGAAGGAVVGAFTGNPGLGAGIGAAAGGLGGGGYQGFTSEDRFKIAYNQCMSGRGHNVIR